MGQRPRTSRQLQHRDDGAVVGPEAIVQPAAFLHPAGWQLEEHVVQRGRGHRSRVWSKPSATAARPARTACRRFPSVPRARCSNPHRPRPARSDRARRGRCAPDGHASRSRKSTAAWPQRTHRDARSRAGAARDDSCRVDSLHRRADRDPSLPVDRQFDGRQVTERKRGQNRIAAVFVRPARGHCASRERSTTPDRDAGRCSRCLRAA